MVQNTVARLTFDQPKRAHAILLLIDLHCQPSRPNQIQLTNVCRRSDLWMCTHLLELNHTGIIPSQPLFSSGGGGCHLTLPSLQYKAISSLVLSVVSWWRLNAIRAGVVLSIFKNLLKTHLLSANTSNSPICRTHTSSEPLYLISLHFTLPKRFSAQCLLQGLLHNVLKLEYYSSNVSHFR